MTLSLARGGGAAVGALALLLASTVAQPVYSQVAPQAATAEAPLNGVYDVRAFGAVGDGKTVDTPAINRAIDAAAGAGGGTVRFPAGTYLSVSIHLRSNVILYLGPGATILAADPSSGPEYDAPEDNPAAKNYQDFGHTHFHNSLIWGENLQNIGIEGPGRIWGKGLVRSDSKPDGRGNKSISLKNCRNVTLRDFTIQHGGWFGILATGVDNLTVDNLKIDTNRDGMDIDCCRQVHVSNCSVNSPYDDGICLKSSYGLGEARATENVTIMNCQVSGYDEGTFLDGTYQRKVKYGNNGPTGRIKCGTESNGGFKNITISNCTFDYCRGLALETVDGAQLEDVTVSNITMRDIVNAPIFLRLGQRMRGPEGVPVGMLRRVRLSGFIIDNADSRECCLLLGLADHPLEDIRLSGIHVYTRGGGTAEQAARALPEQETGYPEPYRFGDTPAAGFFVRHVKGLELSDITVAYASEDRRPALALDDVDGAVLRAISVPRVKDAPTLTLTNVRRFSVKDSQGIPDTERAEADKEGL